MNRYPTWLNLLVLGILMLGSLLALPNIYDSAPAVQLSEIDGKPYDEAMLGQVVAALEADAITPRDSFIQDGRVVVTFATEDEQLISGTKLREKFENVANIAFSAMPELPGWIGTSICAKRTSPLDARESVDTPEGRLLLLSLQARQRVAQREDLLALDEVGLRMQGQRSADGVR